MTAVEETFAPSLDPALHAAVPEWALDTLPRLLREIPVPVSCWAFTREESFRPPRHHRGFYLRRAGKRGVVAVKGSEPLAGDFGELLQRVSEEVSVSNPSEPRRTAEHFASIERKVPCAVSLDEARAEAAAALAIHRRHFAAFGSPAPVPYPLAVLRHSAETGERVTHQIAARLSRTALDQLEPTLRNGLGVLIAYYPGLPTRATALNYVLPAGSPGARMAELRKIVDPARLIDSWSGFLARLLLIGMVPTTPASGRTGNMCQPQNAALDGGFFDVDSVIDLDGLPGPAAIMDALHATVRSFHHTVRTVLVERSYYHLDRAEDLVGDWVSSFVRSRLRAALSEQALPGMAPHPVVAGFFEQELDLAGLTRRLEAYHPPHMLGRSRDEARTFWADNPGLLTESSAG